MRFSLISTNVSIHYPKHFHWMLHSHTRDSSLYFIRHTQLIPHMMRSFILNAFYECSVFSVFLFVSRRDSLPRMMNECVRCKSTILKITSLNYESVSPFTRHLFSWMASLIPIRISNPICNGFCGIWFPLSHLPIAKFCWYLRNQKMVVNHNWQYCRHPVWIELTPQ